MLCPKCGFDNSGSPVVCARCAQPLVSPARRAAVTRARDVWVSRLIDLSRRNRLLYHRDLKTGTLDLTGNDPAAMGNLLRGDSVTLGRLLPQADEAATSSCAQEIRRTALANREEKGLETLSIAIGFASWASADGGRPALSPVILAPVAIEKRGREGRTLALKIIGELQINPVLVFAVETEHGRQIDPDALLGDSCGVRPGSGDRSGRDTQPGWRAPQLELKTFNCNAVWYSAISPFTKWRWSRTSRRTSTRWPRRT